MTALAATRSLGAPARVALTGGIGSGKSTVAKLLQAWAWVIVDTDAIAKQLTLAGGAALPDIVRTFGPRAVDEHGAMDRAHMRELAFNDPQAKRQLEAILHPLIAKEAARQTTLAAQQPVLWDVPLLGPDSHWRHAADAVWVVDCGEATQIERVAKRPGWTAHAAQRVVAQQIDRTSRRAMADAVIHNDGVSMLQLEQLVRSLHLRAVAS